MHKSTNSPRADVALSSAVASKRECVPVSVAHVLGAILNVLHLVVGTATGTGC
jgi:hypothetical protein